MLGMKKLNLKVFAFSISAILFLILTALTTKKINYFKIVSITDSLVIVPIGGNSWSNKNDTIGGKISNLGIENWTNENVNFTTFIRFGVPGNLKVWLKIQELDSECTLEIELQNIKKQILFKKGNQKLYYVGQWTITDTGYKAIKISAISKKGKRFPNINSFQLSGTSVNSKIAYVKDNEGDFFYWGRRGPSVHLNYPINEKLKATWFYNEIIVPEHNDIIGSYFMACGFSEGYFGMQVNSSSERRILFSVWSPFKTDSPDQIPDNQKILILKKGENVHTGEFGNEGSGGQSYLKYNWIAGNKYKFLLHAIPDSTNNTTFTAYFFAPEINKWQLIASFKRPQTKTYLKHLHSFLENFEPEMGTNTREVLFSNQWIADENENWFELNNAKFTVDNTGAKGYRMDYGGGKINDTFFLKNCGFFNTYTLRNSIFIREKSNSKPNINFNQLP